MLQVWYNSEKKWFEAYTEDGKMLAADINLTMVKSPATSRVIVTVECECEVVNDKPKLS